MSAEIRNYQESEGLDDEQMAALLSERLGRAVSIQGFRIIRGRKDAPLEWLEALSIAPKDPSGGGNDGGNDGDEGTRKPPPSPVAVLPFDIPTTKQAIVLIYTTAGKGAAIGMRCPPVAGVWANHAPAIADAYIKWAYENATVARYLGALTFGGMAGQLVIMHATLLIQTLIVSGKFDPGMIVPGAGRTPQETDTIGGEGNGDDAETPGAPNGSSPSAVRSVD